MNETIENKAVYALCLAALIYLAAQIIRSNGGMMYIEVAGFYLLEAWGWICGFCSQHFRAVMILALCLVALLLMWINNRANQQFKENVTRIPEVE